MGAPSGLIAWGGDANLDTSQGWLDGWSVLSGGAARERRPMPGAGLRLGLTSGWSRSDGCWTVRRAERCGSRLARALRGLGWARSGHRTPTQAEVGALLGRDQPVTCLPGVEWPEDAIPRATRRLPRERRERTRHRLLLPFAPTRIVRLRATEPGLWYGKLSCGQGFNCMTRTAPFPIWLMGACGSRRVRRRPRSRLRGLRGRRSHRSPGRGRRRCRRQRLVPAGARSPGAGRQSERGHVA